VKKLLTALSLSLLAVASAIGLGSLRWRAPREPGPPRLERACRGRGPLQAGAAEVRLDLPAGVPLGGFPRLRWASEGVRDPVAARALVLAEPGCAVALVSVEILLVPGDSPGPRPSWREIPGPLDECDRGTTPTPPGGYWRSLGERVATGPYDPALAQRLAERIAEAVTHASETLEAATLQVSRADLPGLARNLDGERVDGRLLALRAVAAGGRTIGELLVFHPPSSGAEPPRLGDWPRRWPLAPRSRADGCRARSDRAIPPAPRRPRRAAGARERVSALSRGRGPLASRPPQQVSLPIRVLGAPPICGDCGRPPQRLGASPSRWYRAVRRCSSLAS
jgi:hypothetical protein